MKSFSEQGRSEGVMENVRLAETGDAENTDAVPEQAAFGEAQHFEYTTSLAQKIFALVVNLLILVELTVAMYFAAQRPESMTPVFFKVFFGLLVPTLVGAFFAKRLINARIAK